MASFLPSSMSLWPFSWRSLAFEQAQNSAALRFGALIGFVLQWPPQRKPHDYASTKSDGPSLGLLW